MRTIQLVVVALLALSAVHAQNNLEDPQPCDSNSGSVSLTGQSNCANSDFGNNLRVINFETAFESAGSDAQLDTHANLANHIVQTSRHVLGVPAIVSDEALARLAWVFRFRHNPEPFVIAKKSTKGDAARLVRFVLSDAGVNSWHHFTEAKITHLIEAVNQSTETTNGFIFRIIEGDVCEYKAIGDTQIQQRIHFFSAVHDETSLTVVFVGSSITGDFIKGHGNSVVLREQTGEFLRQWLLNQWVNLWTCTNPASN
jgi:hypothetical protein